MPQRRGRSGVGVRTIGADVAKLCQQARRFRPIAPFLGGPRGGQQVPDLGRFR
jgi:hypothetical protein